MATQRSPLHWGAWQELGSLCADVGSAVPESALPQHWMREYFLAWQALELQQNEEAMARYEALESATPHNGYLLGNMALACYNVREFDRAEELFERLYRGDPLCLEHADTYSNILFVKEMRAELSHLAHRATSVDPYRVETCCVIGNYYSLCGQHGKAVVYFQRACVSIAATSPLGH